MKHTRNDFKKRCRKADKEELLRIYNELKFEYGKIKGQPIRKKGGLGKEAGKMRVLRRQTAQLLTIARERGIFVRDSDKDIARLRLRI
jgi:ribosomal protein L29